MKRPAPATLEEVGDPADKSFPLNALRGSKTALVLFAQAWYGMQDASFVARAGLTATCVDHQDHNFADMARLYPDGWEFERADVYEFVARTRRRWDVITVDCPSAHFQRCADLLPTFCRIARKAVVLGTGIDTRVEPPDGWRVLTVNRRSFNYGGVFWTAVVK